MYCLFVQSSLSRGEIISEICIEGKKGLPE